MGRHLSRTFSVRSYTVLAREECRGVKKKQRNMTNAIENRIIILLNKDKPSVSETFIKSHIDHLHAPCINIYRHTLIGKPQNPSLSKTFLLRYYNRRNSVKTIRKLIEENHTRALLAEYGHVGADAVPISKFFDLPLIIHFHGHEAYRETVLKEYNRKYEEAFLHAKAIIAVSQDMYHQLIRLGAPKDKVHYNSYGVDLKSFQCQPREKRNKLLLSVGRFVDKKAPHLVLLAFKKVIERHSDARLTMIGDGYLLNACKTLARYLNISTSVDFLGSLDHKEVIGHYLSSDVFIQHSMTAVDGDKEGTPNSVLEAGASCLPVVSTRHAGIPDVIIENETGFLVDEGDVDQMAYYINHLLDNPAMGVQMGTKARKVVEERFSLKYSMDGLRRIVESSL